MKERQGDGMLTIKLDPCNNLAMAAALLAKLFAEIVLTAGTSPDWNDGKQYGDEVQLGNLNASWRWSFTEKKVANAS